jgi:mRNA interferase MazF
VIHDAVKPWQVWLVRLDPQVGSEQAGTRPAIVVGSRAMCDMAGRRLALVVPCTGTDRGLSWQPKIILDKPSVVMCEQVKSVSRHRLVRMLPHEVPVGVREEIRWNLVNLFD